MASPGNRHGANRIGALSLHIDLIRLVRWCFDGTEKPIIVLVCRSETAHATVVFCTSYSHGWLGSRVVSVWTQAQKGPRSNRSRDAVGNSLRQTVNTHCGIFVVSSPYIKQQNW